MLKKMLGKKRSDSASDSSSEEEEEKNPKREKRSSLANIKAKFDHSSKEKTSGITTKLVRPRTGSSSEEDRKKRASVPMMAAETKKSQSNGSLNTIDLSTPVSSSRGSSFHSMESRHSKELTNINEHPITPAIMSVTIHKAQKLEKKGMFGKADPYVLITLGEQKFKSKTINNNQSPEWEFNIKLDFHGDTNQTIIIEVFDDDLGKDDLLGVASMPVLDIIKNNGYVNKWLTLQQCKSGEVLFSVQYSPILPVRTPSPKSISRNASIKSNDSENGKIHSTPAPPTIVSGTIILIVHKARKLEKKGMFGKADPYALLTVGEFKSRTKTISNNQNPEWEFESKFDVYTTRPSTQLFVEIFDEDTGKDDLMGTTTLDINEIIKHQNIVNQWYPLEKCQSGEILLSIFYKPSSSSRTSSIKSRESLTENKNRQSITGILSFDVLKGRKLEKNGLFGKVDPYVVMKLGEKKLMSTAVKNNHDPEWNFNGKFDIDGNSPRHLMLEVYDDDLGNDDLLGTANIELKHLIEHHNLENECQWYPLQNCNSGEVLLSTNFTPTHKIDEIIQDNIVENLREISSDSSSGSDTDDDENSNMRSLNNKLISYIDKVRLIQQASDTWKGIPPTDDRTEEIEMLKSKYEAEIGNWRNKYQTSESNTATANMLANNIGEQNLDLIEKLKEKDCALSKGTNTISILEEEIAELLGKLNLLQNERDKIKDNEMMIKKEINQLKIALQEARDGLDKEKVISSELGAKLDSIEKELKFRIDVLEQQLAEERKRSKLDFSTTDFKLKSEYEKRLLSELKMLRKKYQEETDKSKNEFMHIHSKKIADLQHMLSTERCTNSSAREELRSCQDRLEDFKKKIAELESINLQLTQRATQLAVNMAEEGAAFRSQINSKDKELENMKDEINHQRHEYENILEIKLALDTEIAVYKSLIDAEEKRISRGEMLTAKKESNDDSDKEDTIDIIGDKISSDSENDDSGFMDKIKDEVADALGI